MNKLVFALCVCAAATLVGCGGANGEDTGESYMPDMYYARAYEAYGYNNVSGEYDSLRARRINYNALPVIGTVARGDMGYYHLTNDSVGLLAANAIRNPFDTLNNAVANIKEAERLYLIQCGICHGTALDGNGPLYNGGAGPYPVAPRNLMDAYTKGLTDGHMYHVITYGKGAMGAYASQLRPEQRWWVIKYIRSKQGVGGAQATDTTAATNADPNTNRNVAPPNKQVVNPSTPSN